MNKKIRSECRFYEKKYLGVMGEYMAVNPVPSNDDSLGYTSKKGGIFITFAEKNFKDVPVKKWSFFRMGIFTHETLHQKFTDFDTNKKIGDTYKGSARKVFYLLSNVLEDPAIEYWALSAIGGILLKSLKYTIAQVYKSSPSIEESTTAFQQYVNALIQVGDMGPVKGNFTFDESEKAFQETIGLFNKGIHEPNPSKRIYIAKEITEKTRFLWEPLSSDEVDDINLDYTSSHSAMNGEGHGSEGEIGDDDSSKEKRRKKVIMQYETSDEEDAANKTSENDKNIDDFANKQEELEDPDSNASIEDENAGNTENSDDYFNEEEYEISSEEIDKLNNELENISKELEKEDKAEKLSDLDEIEDIDIKSPKMPSKTCLNRKILNNSSALTNIYNEIVNRHSIAIKSSILSLKRVFKNDIGDKKNTSTGNVNCYRASTKNSARVFFKHTESCNKKDAAIFIAVDESLSMNHQLRYISARETCICLAEIFGSLDIPVYVMGYSADTMGYDVIHDHFLRWSTKSQDRLPLANIGCHMDNCDGYSIRYATELLKKRKAEHKLLIVISDGRPAAINYPNAISDTADAIRDAKKIASVLGVNIGNDDAETIRNMYGLDFMKISSVNELFNELNKKLIKIIKGW